MIKFLENELYEKTKGTQSEILFAQWNYDKKIIPSALHAVSNLFPHYSLHDESHSITIINNIVRVLGKLNIAKLSAIDIWLILEASYSHDIGMVVSSEKLIQSLKSKDFIDFFQNLILDNKNGLHEFAKQFEIIEGKINYKQNLLDLELHDGIKFILAEFFRRKHADRSKEIIVNPLGELALTSPRGVIPQRIFKILGNICASHTKNFVDVMELPFCEVGIDIEDAHPRFISCLLRIGDLLDLDNNRFSEVMLRTLSKIPVDTLNHKAKHLSIESFRVDREIIEITANCRDYDTANITQHWFNYLNSEISQQMINWNNIVPYKDFGYLPTIGTLKVELANYDYIDGKNKPKFSVDTDKALSLLQGAGLYDGAYQCIREILQNAIDASLMRMWLEYSGIKDFTSPLSNDFIELTKEFPVTITISEKDIEGDWKKWLIEIEDKGTGISSHDLKFLMNTGSSSKNRNKSNIVESMPIWMRPSGTFGIGFQSIFMLTDLVTIETKSFFNEEFQIIELNSPNSTKDGDILIQKKKTTHTTKPGTKIIINHKTKAIPVRYSIKGEHKNASRIAHNYDPFSHESLDIELGKVLDEIFDFAHKSYLPIKLNIDKDKIETRTGKLKQFDYFDEENSLELKIHFGYITNRWRVFTYYKNQKAENNISMKFLGLEVNIHKDKASRVLTLNRNKIKPEYNSELQTQIFNSLFKLFTTGFDKIFKTNEQKVLGSMFLDFYSGIEYLKEFDTNPYKQWEKLKINVGNKDLELKKLLHSINTLKLIYDNRINIAIGDVYELKGKELTLTLKGGSASFDYTDFFLFKASDHFTSIKKTTNPENNLREVLFTKTNQKSPITKEELLNVINNLRNGLYSARVIIPCIEEYFNLRIKDDAYKSYLHHYRFDSNIYLPFPKMLSPYLVEEIDDRKRILKLELNEKSLDWVYKNRYDDQTTKEEIIKAYDKFIGEIDIDEINSKP
jgi:hypothetical protein